MGVDNQGLRCRFGLGGLGGMATATDEKGGSTQADEAGQNGMSHWRVKSLAVEWSAQSLVSPKVFILDAWV